MSRDARLGKYARAGGSDHILWGAFDPLWIIYSIEIVYVNIIYYLLVFWRNSLFPTVSQRNAGNVGSVGCEPA